MFGGGGGMFKDLNEKQGRNGASDLLAVLLQKWKSASGIRQLIYFIRRFQRLRLYAKCVVLVATASVLLALYIFCPMFFSPGWVLPETCLAEDCKLKEPLQLSGLSPNLLLVLVHASASEHETRDAIRETWLSGISNRLSSPIQYRFVLGSHDVPNSVMELVTTEALKHKDILIFPTITDSITSLTNRTLLSFKYAYETFNFKYVLKCDDDSFADILRIATELQQRKSAKPLYWGYMRGSNSAANYFGRYSEHQWHICNNYTPYALGGGYVLSQELTKILAKNAEFLKHYTSEDVSIGAWLAPYSIELKHDARFNVNTPSRGCKDPYLISHKVNTERLWSYQESMLLEGRMCSWRTYSFGASGYIYNWTSPCHSGMCCRRNSFVP